MKHAKLYTYLGIAGALLVPAIAVAAIEIPNVFEGGDPVSASEMNENFEVMASAIEVLEHKVEALESAGLQPPVLLDEYEAPQTDLIVKYQVHTDGIMTARSMGNGYTSTTVRFSVSDDPDALEPCFDNCTVALGRGYNGSSGAVFLAAGQYVGLKVRELNEEAALGIFWQPLREPNSEENKPTLVETTAP